MPHKKNRGQQTSNDIWNLELSHEQPSYACCAAAPLHSIPLPEPYYQYSMLGLPVFEIEARNQVKPSKFDCYM